MERLSCYIIAGDYAKGCQSKPKTSASTDNRDENKKNMEAEVPPMMLPASPGLCSWRAPQAWRALFHLPLPRAEAQRAALCTCLERLERL